MARKIVHQLVDDLDGTELEIGDGETILFSLDGTAYEIDLSSANASALRDALATYTAAGRRVSGGRPSTGAARGARKTNGRDYAPVREWAKENGYSVSERGRVASTVLDAYDAAH